MFNYSITGMGYVYRQLRLENRRAESAANFNLMMFLHQMNTFLGSTDRNAYANALRHLEKTVTGIKACGEPYYTGDDNAMRRLHEEGVRVWKDFSNLNQENAPSFIKKIVTFVRGHFSNLDNTRNPLLQVSSMLTEESARQERLVKVAELNEGICGLFEMATKRPHLQYQAENEEGQHNFLPFLAGQLTRIIRSFSEKNSDPIRDNEGKAVFRGLIKIVHENQETLKNLCVEDSKARAFINSVIALSGKDPEESGAFYNEMANAVRSAYRSDEAQVGENDLVNFVRNQAEKIHDLLPADMQSNNRQVVRRVVKGFKAQQDHGQGALICGTDSDRVNSSQLFGEGPGGPFIEMFIDPWKGLDSTESWSKKATDGLKEFMGKVEDAFWKQKKLYQYTSVTDTKNTWEEAFKSDEEQALAVVGAMIQNRRNEYLRSSGLFAFTQAQTEEVQARCVKEVIEFGLEHNMFTHEQQVALFIKYRTYLIDGTSLQPQGQSEEKKFEGYRN